MHIYSLTYALTLTHRHIHWYIILYTHEFINIHTHILTYTYTCWHTHTDTHSYKPILIHWYSQKLTHSHKFIYTPHILSGINTSTLTQTYTLAHISKQAYLNTPTQRSMYSHSEMKKDLDSGETEGDIVKTWGLKWRWKKIYNRTKQPDNQRFLSEENNKSWI